VPLKPKKKWRELRRGQRVVVVVAGAAQVALTAAAYRDLVKRPAAEVNGPKIAWGLALLVNWAGPLAYFAKGRVTS
jgi:Phospholipase_D-nuclease N-terminal